jgi:hypothetical protein
VKSESSDDDNLDRVIIKTPQETRFPTHQYRDQSKNQQVYKKPENQAYLIEEDFESIPRPIIRGSLVIPDIWELEPSIRSYAFSKMLEDTNRKISRWISQVTPGASLHATGELTQDFAFFTLLGKYTSIPEAEWEPKGYVRIGHVCTKL